MKKRILIVLLAIAALLSTFALACCEEEPEVNQKDPAYSQPDDSGHNDPDTNPDKNPDQNPDKTPDTDPDNPDNPDKGDEEDDGSCVHSYGAWKVTVTPTCGREGEQVRTWQKCGKTEKMTLQKTDHDYLEEVVEQPDCTTEGLKKFTCKYDSSHTYTEVMPKLGHDITGDGVSKEPTCTEPGFSRSGVCNRCHQKIENEEIPALGHQMSAVEVIKQPTCTEDGTGESHCLRDGCNEKKTETVPKLEHRFSEQVISYPDCTNTGKKIKTCTRPDCNYSEEEVTPALGHNWYAENPTKAPTCTQGGYSDEATCKRCGIKEENVELPPLGHALVPTDRSEYASCLTPGKNVYACSRCDHIEEEIIPALGHDLSYIIRKEPTCQSTGTKYTYCRRSSCNYDVTETMPKVDHDYSRTHWITRPTCTTGGEKYMYCRFCNKQQPNELVPANGHDWEEQSIDKLPTCSEKGHSSHRCITCGTLEEYDIDKVAHRYGEYIVDEPATADREGSKSKHCIYCGARSESMSIPKLSGDEVTLEVRLRRANGMMVSPNNDRTYHDAKYEFYKDSVLLKSIPVTGETMECTVSKEANKLKVTGLSRGFSTVEEEYPIEAGSPIVTVELKGGIIQGERSVVNGKNVTATPDPLLVVGDFMYDLYIYNTMDHTKDNWLSELIKDKKLVFLDFFHTQCGWCTIHMKQFILAYERDLYKYRDDILVLMLDVMSYESDNLINIYRSNEHIPEDFVTATCSFESVAVSRWFVDHVPTPGHIWLDNEGLIFYRKVTQTQEDFTKFVEDYFDRFNANAAEKETMKKTNAVALSLEPDMGAGNDRLGEVPYVELFKEKRRFALQTTSRV